jgi:polyphosphate kinase
MDGTGKRKDSPPRLLDRELSWLQFNARVQAEADHPGNPLLERAKFLAIVTSNLDEFMQVRYHRVLEAAQGADAETILPCGLTSAEKLTRINKTILRQQNLQYLFYEAVHSELFHLGVQVYPSFVLTDAMQGRIRDIFHNELLPRLKPVPWGEEIAPISQKRLHLLVRLRPKSGADVRFATVPLPASQRLYELPAEGTRRCFIRTEDLARLFLPQLFPEDRAEEASVFRLIRNQDFPIAEQADVSAAVREMLLKRRDGAVMRLEAEERMSAELLQLLMARFQVPAARRYRVTGPLDLSKLFMSLYGQLDRPELKYPRAEHVTPAPLAGEDILQSIAQQDFLLFHPYHSFDPVVNFVNAAAADPDVTSIKITLYRVGGNSPIVRALRKAAEAGKQVTVLFEARARFDEDNNLTQGRRLRRAGVNVIFGLPMYKTHSKALLVTRMESGELRRYLHLGTGNYHDGTARLYTDMALLTADPALGEDAARFFYGLEGVGQPFATTQLVRAPDQLKPRLLSLIARERDHALHGRPNGIIAKMNSLSDPHIVEALYAASCAGVSVELIVRGVCTLVPGVSHMSENIRVTSIVGRYLEHVRAFRFENGGQSETYLSSADWMPRNLDRRVELMFPVRDAAAKRGVDSVLALQCADNQKRWRLLSDGSYVHIDADGHTPVNAQETLLARRLAAVLAGEAAGGPRSPKKLHGKADRP